MYLLYLKIIGKHDAAKSLKYKYLKIDDLKRQNEQLKKETAQIQEATYKILKDLGADITLEEVRNNDSNNDPLPTLEEAQKRKNTALQESFKIDLLRIVTDCSIIEMMAFAPENKKNLANESISKFKRQLEPDIDNVINEFVKNKSLYKSLFDADIRNDIICMFNLDEFIKQTYKGKAPLGSTLVDADGNMFDSKITFRQYIDQKELIIGFDNLNKLKAIMPPSNEIL